MIIRRGKDKDIDKCIEISKMPELQMYDGALYSRSYFSDGIRRRFYVAVDDGHVVGFLLGFMLTPRVAYIDLMAVVEEYRGKGIGKMILDYFREELKASGASDYFLVAPKANERTLDFYRSVGMTQGKEYVLFFENVD